MGSTDTKSWSMRSVLRQAGELNGVDLALRLTLLELLLRPIGNWTIRPFILSLAIIGLLFPRHIRRPVLWLALAGLTGLRVVLDWPLPDNHAYLLCYWCLAVFVCLVSQDADQDTDTSLALNARLLIGLAFAFATLWKLVLSPDYLDGRFLRVSMLTDPRFEGFAQLVGGLSAETFTELRAFVSQHVDGQLFGTFVSPQQPTRFIWTAHVATWWTVVMEGAVALTFLWPAGQGLPQVAQLRNVFLLLFCATVYAVATVAGFAWLLLAMGVAQCESERWKTKLAYLFVFALVLFYRAVPWTELFLQ